VSPGSVAGHSVGDWIQCSGQFSVSHDQCSATSPTVTLEPPHYSDETCNVIFQEILRQIQILLTLLLDLILVHTICSDPSCSPKIPYLYSFWACMGFRVDCRTPGSYPLWAWALKRRFPHACCWILWSRPSRLLQGNTRRTDHNLSIHVCDWPHSQAHWQGVSTFKWYNFSVSTYYRLLWIDNSH